MYSILDLNPDVRSAELRYRRNRLSGAPTRRTVLTRRTKAA